MRFDALYLLWYPRETPHTSAIKTGHQDGSNLHSCDPPSSPSSFHTSKSPLQCLHPLLSWSSEAQSRYLDSFRAMHVDLSASILVYSSQTMQPPDYSFPWLSSLVSICNQLVATSLAILPVDYPTGWQTSSYCTSSGTTRGMGRPSREPMDRLSHLRSCHRLAVVNRALALSIHQ